MTGPNSELANPSPESENLPELKILKLRRQDGYYIQELRETVILQAELTEEEMRFKKRLFEEV